MEIRNIAVTGGAGFIGRHIVSQLLENGHRLTLMVQRTESCPAEWSRNDRIRIVKTGPLETAADLHQILADARVVIHLAGLAHIPRGSRSDDAFFRANVEATQRVAKAAATAGINTFINLSSLAAVTPNASSKLINDTTDEGPASAYGRSKQIAEHSLVELADKGTFAVSLRPPLVVGADARGNWALLQRLAISGLPLPFASVRNRRSLVGIDTLVQAIIHLSTGNWPAEQSGNYCLADRDSLSLSEIISALRRGMAIPPRLFAFPPSWLMRLGQAAGRPQMVSGLLGNLEVDSSRFRANFNFEPTTNLLQTISESGASYRHMREQKTARGNNQ